MRHRKGNKKLNKPTDQRVALLKNLVFSLVEFSKVKTTDLRAKQASRLFSRLITMAKSDSVYARRQVFKVISNKDFVKRLFDLAKSVKQWNGGYTRCTKLKYRKGDAALITLLEVNI